MSDMEFIDQDDRRVTMQYKTDNDIPNGNHVLAIPIFQNQLLFTKHSKRGIEFLEVKLKLMKLVNKRLLENFMKKQVER